MTANLDQLSDETLVKRAQNRDLQAFVILYERYLPVVYRRVRYVVPESVIEDVVQEVFISMLSSLHSFNGTSSFATWMHTLTSRRVADYYRRRQPESMPLEIALDGVNHGTVSALSASADTAIADKQIDVQQAFGHLPEHYQEVLVLRLAEELPFAECARQMGRSLEATKSLFRRAIANLRDHLQVSHG